MPTLENRISTLEKKADPHALETVLIRFVSMEGEDPPLTEIRYGQKVWTIRPGETVQEFEARAIAEAVPEPGHTAAILLAE